MGPAKNRASIEKLGWIIDQMDHEPLARGAAVISAEIATEGDPFKILVFTMLSARTKDETTLRVVEDLFTRASTPKEIARIPLSELERILYGIGFFHVKSRHLLAMCRILASKGSAVPDNLEGLLDLPGVGRKTANIVLARAYGKSALGVDVHVHRISNRIGIVHTRKPEDTEKALVKITPPRLLAKLNRCFVAFGQTVCLPRNPRCGSCPLNQLCYRINVENQCPACRYGKRG